MTSIAQSWRVQRASLTVGKSYVVIPRASLSSWRLLSSKSYCTVTWV